MTKWIVDADHSLVEFSVKHMMIAKVKGQFGKFEGSFSGDPADLTTGSLEFKIDAASIDTKNEGRDNHLRSADFFDTETFPSITFTSIEIKSSGEDEYKVTGDVSIHGVTRKETFDVTFEGIAQDPWGNTKAGFSAAAKIKRSDYGLVWNTALETGGVLVGDQINLSLEIESFKQV